MFKIKEKSITFAGIITSLFIFIIPFLTSHKLFFGATNIRVFIITLMTLVIAVLFGLRLFVTKDITVTPTKRILGYLMIGMGLIWVITAFTGIDFRQSFWSDLLRSVGVIYLVHIGFMTYFLSELLSKRDWRLVFRTLAISGVIFSFLYFFGSAGLGVFGDAAQKLTLVRRGAQFGNETFAGLYILFTFGFTLLEMSRTRWFSGKFWGWAFLALVQFASPLFFNFDILAKKVSFGQAFDNPALFLGDARASSAAAIFIILFLLGYVILRKVIRNDHIKKIISKIYGGLWVVGLVTLFILLLVPNTPINDAYVEQSTAARPMVWGEGWQGIAERPVLGWGHENFEYVNFTYFNNDLHRPDFLGEVWFDRAHNVFIDNLVTVGIVGSLGLFAILIYLIFVFARASKRGHIEPKEALILGALLVAHIVQMQTSFETESTYLLWGLILGYGLWLERKMVESDSSSLRVTFPRQTTQLIATFVLIATIVSTVFVFGFEYHRQKALYRMFVTSNFDARLAYLDDALQRPKSSTVIRHSANSMIDGVLGNAQVIFSDSQNIQRVLSEVHEYSARYEAFNHIHPNEYRAKVNFAYLLLFQTTLGERQTDRAREILDEAEAISPNSPAVDVLRSLSYVYEGNFDAATASIEEGINMNTAIPMTKQVAGYIEHQKTTFPNITFLRLENL